MTVTALVQCAPIDPWRSCPGGVYDDGVVRVRSGAEVPLAVYRAPDGRIAVDHGLRPAELDDELGAPLAAALALHTDDHEVFARAFTGLVLTSRPRAEQAWELFYRNSLARIRHERRPGYAAVYRHALELVPSTTVFDLGASFGFLSLHLAAGGRRVQAWEPDPGTADLLTRMSRRLRLPVDVVAPGAPLESVPNRSVETVTLLHVLEHVPADVGLTLLDHAVRIARLRVVVAVPVEAHPTALYGHLRTFDTAALSALGTRSGHPYDVHEHHGGWLVIDRL